MAELKPAPSYLFSLFQLKCPRCRRGDMFVNKNAYSKLNPKAITDMPDHCAVCGQKFTMEPGFWFGTGYVSYALTIAISVATFVAAYVLIGLSFSNNSIFIWLIVNSILLIVLQPWLMRLSRAIYIRFFVKYDPSYEESTRRKFDY